MTSDDSRVSDHNPQSPHGRLQHARRMRRKPVLMRRGSIATFVQLGLAAAIALLACILVIAILIFIEGDRSRPASILPKASPLPGPNSTSEESALTPTALEIQRLRSLSKELEEQIARSRTDAAVAARTEAHVLAQVEKEIVKTRSATTRLLSKVEDMGAAPVVTRPPPSQAEVATPQATAATPSGAQAMVRVFYGTDRAIRPSALSLSERYSSERGPSSLGTVDVSIPAGHALGKLEQKFWPWHSENDASRFFVVQRTEVLNKDQFISRLNETFARLDTRSALVFIHGYNVSFEDAALRSAQMAFDLDMKSLPAFFSWPSQGSAPRYTIDEQMAEWAEPHLRRFLETFANETRAESIIVLAHSMGSRPTTRALASLLSARPELQTRFKEIILAAPDIDADVFKDDLLPPLLEMQQRVTMYASSGDRALGASRAVHGAPRAGDAGRNIVILSGLETLDASSIDTDFLGHSYYGSTRALLTDINLLVNQNMRAARRPFLETRSVANVPYWVFKP
jgi:esterase/lipase superfamily enzyme